MTRESHPADSEQLRLDNRFRLVVSLIALAIAGLLHEMEFIPTSGRLAGFSCLTPFPTACPICGF